MIDALINFLQKLKNNSNATDSSGSVGCGKKTYYFFLIIMIILNFPLGKFLVISLDSLLEGDFGSENMPNYIFFVLLVLLVLLLIGLYSFFRQRRNFFSGSLNIWKISYTVYFPWSIFLLLTYIFMLSLFDGPSFNHMIMSMWRFGKYLSTSVNAIISSLLLISPALWMIGNKFSSLTLKPFYQKCVSFFSGYNIGYLVVLSALIAWKMIVESGEVISYLNKGIRFFIISLFFITFPLISLRYSLHVRNKKGVIFYTFLFLFTMVVFTYSKDAISQITSYAVHRADRVLETGGDNYSTYKKAEIPFLSQAYFVMYKRGIRFNQFSFVKLFDSVPEAYFGSRLGDASLKNTDSRGTNASKVGENADVTLKLVEIENTILSSKDEIDVLKTIYKFHVINKVNINQEVIIQFQTPSQNSIVTDLKLGLNGEMIGIIAPRGAANKVYKDSLRINKDPALLEKMGLNTYRLRVFPIPPKIDIKTQGRQLVEFTVLSPLETGKSMTYSPQISLINLHVNKETSLISKVYKGGELVHEDRIENTNIEQYLSQDHILSGSLINATSPITLSDYCIPQIKTSLSDSHMSSGFSGQYQTQLPTNNAPKKITKTSIFFDNSLSVKRNEVSSFYGPLYDAIKNHNNKIQDVDIFLFNFFVEKVVSLEDMKFWGYSDIDGLLNYIEENNVTNQRIIIVTDDDNFNFTKGENTNRNFSKVLTNEIHLIVLGKRVKTYKSDFMSLLASSQGTIHTAKTMSQFNGVLSDIFRQPSDPLTECVSGTIFSQTRKVESQNTEVQKILAGMWSNVLMSSIENRDDRDFIAQQQTLFAKKYNIVNQFNSMIALETEQQMRDLKRYQEQQDKYDSSYENLGSTRSNRSSMPQQDRGTLFPQTDTETSPKMGGNDNSPFILDSYVLDSNFADTESSNSYRNRNSGGYNSSKPINVNLRIVLCILLVYGIQLYQLCLICALLYGIYFKKSGPTLSTSGSSSNEVSSSQISTNTPTI